MQRMVLLLLSCLQLWFHFAAGTITRHPVNVTAPLNTNVSFTCEGAPGELIWSINNVQIRDEGVRMLFPSADFYIPLRQAVSSELFIIGLDNNNKTAVKCIIFNGKTLVEESDIAFLYLYGSPNPPTNLDMSTQGTDFILTWNAPFAISGEDISYVVTTTNRATQQSMTQNVTGTMALISESIGERDCGLYEFNVKSRNGFGISTTGVVGSLNVPTVPNVLRSSEIQLTASRVPTVSVQIMFRAPNPCNAYRVTSYNISFDDQTDSSASFSTIGIQTFEDITFIIDDQNTALQRNQFYLVTVEAINSAGSTFSEQVPLYTTGLQSSSVVLEVNDTASVTCNFALGSDALGCEVSFYASSMSDSMELLFAKNITREPSSNTVTQNIPLMGQLEGRTVTVQVAEWQAGGFVGSIAISPQVINVSAPTTSPPDATTTVDMMMTTSSDGTARTTTVGGGGGGSGVPLGGNLYIVVGVAASVVVMFLLLIIVAILVICSLNRRNKIRNKAELARMNSLKDNNAYGTGTLPVTLTSSSPLPNGISRNNTYYEKSFDEGLGATNGNPPPLYETIANKKDLGASNGASPVVPNPVYGSSEPKSPLVVNPIYAEAQPHVSTDERTPKGFAVDISGLNPVYSGLVTSDQFSSSNESTPVKKSYESAVPLPALQDTGPRYGNAPIHAGPGIPASAALDLIKASEQGTPLRRATGSPPPAPNLGVPIYEEVKHPKSRTLSSSDHERLTGGVGFPMRSLSHTDGDRNGPAGFPMKRNDSYGMIVGSDVSAPTSPQPNTPKTPPKNGSAQQQQLDGTSVESPPPIPVKTGSISSSNPSSPTLTSEQVPSAPISP